MDVRGMRNEKTEKSRKNLETDEIVEQKTESINLSLFYGRRCSVQRRAPNRVFWQAQM